MLNMYFLKLRVNGLQTLKSWILVTQEGRKDGDSWLHWLVMPKSWETLV